MKPGRQAARSAHCYESQQHIKDSDMSNPAIAVLLSQALNIPVVPPRGGYTPQAGRPFFHIAYAAHGGLTKEAAMTAATKITKLFKQAKIFLVAAHPSTLWEGGYGIDLSFPSAYHRTVAKTLQATRINLEPFIKQAIKQTSEARQNTGPKRNVHYTKLPKLRATKAPG